jgi:RND family efflux transporter MFP subunit
MNSCRPFVFSATALLLGVLLFPACKPRTVAVAAPLDVRFVIARPVDRGRSDTAGAAFLGLLRGDPETSLSFKVNGQIARIGPADGTEDWNEGTVVEKDTVLAQLDTANFVNAVAATRARTEYARAAFARSAELFVAANLSKNEFEASRAQKDTAEADLAQAEQNLRDTTLRAPYAGAILVRLARNNEYAAAGRPVLRLGGFRQMKLEIGVPDTLLGRLAVGQDYPVKVSAFEGGEFTGRISEIGTAATEGSRLFHVVLDLPNADGRLKSGMTATVRLGHYGAQPAAGMVVPLSALVSPARASAGQGAAAVFVVGDDQMARERLVRTGDLIESSIIVTDGLKAGERVVSVGAGQLFEGAPVNATPAVP